MRRDVLLAAFVGGAVGLSACDRGTPGPGKGTPVPAAPTGPSKPTPAPADKPGLVVTNQIGFTIQKGTETGLEVAAEGQDNWITDGEAKIQKSLIGKAGLDRALRIERFAVTDDTRVVRLDVGPSAPSSLLGRAASDTDPAGVPELVDAGGTRYEPVGFIYRDDSIAHVRYTPGKPIKSMEELTRAGITLSSSRADQALELIFRVSRGVKITTFAIGNRRVTVFEPPIPADAKQK